MADATEAVAAGFVALSAGRATVPLRPSVPLSAAGVAFAMPVSLDGGRWFAVKVVSVAPVNAAAGRPVVSAAILLGDAESGELVALLEGGALTALRTGAAGGVAARALSRPSSAAVALFGGGAQARTQLVALVAVRPVREVRVVTRDPVNAATFCAWAATEPCLRDIRIQRANRREAVESADIVVTATSSPTPVFDGRWLGKGVHITAVGSYAPHMRELDDEALGGARLVVDQRDAALAECGELHGRSADELVEIGEILAGRVAGRSTAEERTVFKSVGNAIQDLVVATLAYERARAGGIGEEVAFP